MKFFAWAFQGKETFSDELTESEFKTAAASAALMFRFVEAEETFRALLDNYSELEVSLLSIGQDYLINGHIRHSRAMRYRLLLDRRYANFLSTCRLYLDYANAVSGRGELDAEGKSRVKRASSQEYDSSLGYRVMEALRNYVQHRGFPIGQTVFQQRGGNASNRESTEISITPSLSVERLRTGGFKPSVLSEIEPFGEFPDLRPWTREYVDGLRSVHSALSEQTRSGLDEAISNYDANCRRFVGRIASDDVIVRVESRDDSNRTLERHAFTREVLQHVNELRLENRPRGRVSMQYVSNGICPI